jgi:Sulfotransferase family
MTFLSQIDTYHAQATAAAGGLDDFGDTDYLAPMRLLLSDIDAHCRLSPLGEQVVAGNMIAHLTGRLLALDGFKRHPAFASSPIEKPVFIVGTMRTGTTALQTLLAADPENQALELWLANTPMPRPPRVTWDANPLYRMRVQTLEQFYRIAPIADAHPMSAERPDECFWTMDQTLWSPPKAMCFDVPNYFDWCFTADVTYAYRYYRRVLGLIAGGSHKRWVLKSPCHLWGLDALLEVFPDACIVFMHRDIMTSMASTGSVAAAIHLPMEPGLSHVDIGAQALRDWGRALDKSEQVRRKHDAARFIDVHADDLHADPLGTVERIYRGFGIPLSESSRHAIAQQAQRDPRAGHGERHYTAHTFGLTRENVNAAIGAYRERLNAIEAQRRRTSA